MTKVHGYLRPRPGEPEPFAGDRASPAASAITAYAEGQGLGAVSWWIETSRTRPTRIAERADGAELLRALRPDDVLLVHTVAELADYPSDLDALVRGLAGRGIALEVVTLANADRSRQLKQAIDAFSGLEGELEKTREELAKVQAIADQRLAHSIKVALAQMVENYGLPSTLRMGIPSTVGDVNAPLGNGGIGPVIRAKREAKGLSQGALAKVLGVTQPTISKLEAGTSTAGWQEAIEYLTAGEVKGEQHGGCVTRRS